MKQNQPMANDAIVVLGDISTVAVARVAKQFGWEVLNVKSIDQLEQVSAERQVIAVLFNHNQTAWRTALESVLDAACEALPIVCHRFSDMVDWPELAEAGAFHSLSLPFDDAELMQSLRFVSARTEMKTHRQTSRPPRFGAVATG
jgi:DNA-binding NtrC family response regulator